MNSDIRRFLLWLTVAVIVIGSFLAIMFLSGGPNPGIDGKLTDGVTATDWVKGNPESKVTLVEYSDLQCPACKARLPLIKKIMDEFSNHIRFIYRHFPLRQLHKNSQIAAQAAEAAGLQGKFWEMHDQLFENQEAWSQLEGDLLLTAFDLYANNIQLDIARFNSDLNSNAVIAAVKADADSGEGANVTSTPTFFLNGSKINPADYEDFRALVREAIEAANS